MPLLEKRKNRRAREKEGEASGEVRGWSCERGKG